MKLSYLCSLNALFPFFSRGAHVTLWRREEQSQCKDSTDLNLINTEAKIDTVCRELSSPFYQEVLWDLALQRLLEGPVQVDKKKEKKQLKNSDKNNIFKVKVSDIICY